MLNTESRYGEHTQHHYKVFFYSYYLLYTNFDKTIKTAWLDFAN